MDGALFQPVPVNGTLGGTTGASGVTLQLHRWVSAAADQKAESYESSTGEGSSLLHYSGSFPGHLCWELPPAASPKWPQVCRLPFAHFHRLFLWRFPRKWQCAMEKAGESEALLPLLRSLFPEYFFFKQIRQTR